MSGRELLARLAVPRRVGSTGHAATRALLAAELGARGFSLDEIPFHASAQSLAAVAAAGYALAAVAAAIAARVVPVPAQVLAALFVALGLLALLGAAEGEGVTLVARRAPGPPRVWLVAHYDSKGQPLSMAARLVAVGTCVTGAVLVALGWFVVSRAHPLTLLLLVPAVAGGLLLGRNGVLTDRSPGAVDNATGVVTVLQALDLLPREAPVGVLFPDAEEFGLAGARDLVRRHPETLREAAVVNFDGIDDAGPVRLVAHRPGPLAGRLAAAFGVRPSRLPVVVDGMALAAASAECVTVLKGSWRTARRVHTRRDTADALTLDGAATVARAVARAIVDGGGPGV